MGSKKSSRQYWELGGLVVLKEKERAWLKEEALLARVKPPCSIEGNRVCIG
jgi:hypothetical protein